MSPKWLKLLRHQRRRGRLALTLPFLIGALRKPIGIPFGKVHDGYDALILLLGYFTRETPEPETVRIHTCPNLGQPVASITQLQYYPGYAKWGKTKSEPTPLDIDPPYRPVDPADIAEAAKLLWPNVSSALENALFSYSKAMKAYCAFGDEDLRFIEEALAYDEENEL